MITTGARSEITTDAPTREGNGTSRRWTREVNGTLYGFNLVLMPNGEVRIFTVRFNGYVGGPSFACAWDRVSVRTIAPAVTKTTAEDFTAEELSRFDSRREGEVFTHALSFTPWQRCQHGKQIVTVRAHWADDCGRTVTTGRENHTQVFDRSVHADGSGPADNNGLASQCYGTIRRCPDCGSFGTLVTRQLNYGDDTTCTIPTCEYHSYYSIGD